MGSKMDSTKYQFWKRPMWQSYPKSWSVCDWVCLGTKSCSHITMFSLSSGSLSEGPRGLLYSLRVSVYPAWLAVMKSVCLLVNRDCVRLLCFQKLQLGWSSWRSRALWCLVPAPTSTSIWTTRSVHPTTTVPHTHIPTQAFMLGSDKSKQLSQNFQITDLNWYNFYVFTF